MHRAKNIDRLVNVKKIIRKDGIYDRAGRREMFGK